MKKTSSFDDNDEEKTPKKGNKRRERELTHDTTRKIGGRKEKKNLEV